MPVAKRWTVDIYLSEQASGTSAVTHAEARLHTGDATDLRGRGVVHRHPADADIPEIGDELAVARALSDLVQRLLRAAADDLEGVTHEPVASLTD